MGYKLEFYVTLEDSVKMRFNRSSSSIIPQWRRYAIVCFFKSMQTLMVNVRLTSFHTKSILSRSSRSIRIRWCSYTNVVPLNIFLYFYEVNETDARFNVTFQGGQCRIYLTFEFGRKSRTILLPTTTSFKYSYLLTFAMRQVGLFVIFEQPRCIWHYHWVLSREDA